MKSLFQEYYAPTRDEYNRLWSKGLVVFDTNVLLNLYRTPSETRKEILALLNILKDRIWIPYHAALEFQRSRLSVIAAERANITKVLNVSEEMVKTLREKIDSLQIDKFGIGVDANDLVNKIEGANKEVREAIRKINDALPNIDHSDPVRDKLDSILFGRIGEGPKDQNELDAMIADGDFRYDNQIPPGFSDSNKSKNPLDSHFFHNSIKYERKFGDLIIWKQLLNYVKLKSVSDVILVTGDRKEDWWLRLQGRTLGPHPDLVREMLNVGGDMSFWMYSFDQFLEQSKNYTSAKISDQSIEEVKNSTHFIETLLRSIYNKESDKKATLEYKTPITIDINAIGHIEEAVFKWLREEREGITRNNRTFPDFISQIDGETQGYEVKIVRNETVLTSSSSIANALSRGYVELNEQRLSKFTLIAVLAEYKSEDEIVDRIEVIAIRANRTISKYPISEIIVGYVADDTMFYPIYRSDGSSSLGKLFE